VSEDILTVVGRCKEITEKSGWTQFSIDVGTKYPVRISTKLPDLIAEGRAVGENEAIWKYKESQGNENQNKPGTYYTNRYFSGVELVTDENRELAEQVNASHPVAASGGGGRSASRDPDERGSIERQTIVKAAMPLYPPGLIKTDAEFVALLGRLATFVAGTPTLGVVSTGTATSEEVVDRPPDDDVPAHSDDDIPF
jgi:hypothetical protein